MRIARVWAMANSETFSIKPVRDFVTRHLAGKTLIVDPFAGRSRIAQITNDLNSKMGAQYHMDSVSFLEKLLSDGVKADGAIFDPPYSPRQIKECYNSVGLKMGALDAMRTNWKKERDCLNKILTEDATVVSCNWNSMGMGSKRGWAIDEILLVCHGVGHNDLICIAERRIPAGRSAGWRRNSTKCAKSSRVYRESSSM